MTTKVSAVIPAAGLGQRMKSGCPKPFLLLKEEFIFLHTVRAVCSCPLINEVILVVNKKHKPKVRELIKGQDFKKVKHIVSGGKSRAESVLNGLKYVSRKYRYVLIHDGARPLVTQKILSRCIKALIDDGSLSGCIAAVPVKSTIKEVNTRTKLVASTLRRSTLWKVQTPQVFKKQELLRAYKNIVFSKFKDYKDDSQIVEELEGKIKVVNSDDSNIKITTPFDLKMAKALMR